MAACSSSRALAAVRRCHPPSLAMRHVASSSSSFPSSSSWCPLSIRGGRLQLPCPLLRKSVTWTWRKAVAAEGRGKPEAAGIPRTLQLGAMIIVWYLLYIYFNIYNKLVLNAVPFPYTVTTFQFAFGSCFVTFMWLLNLHPKPRLSLQQYAVILPLAIMNTLGNAFTNISLGNVAVSFTHTIKAMEPFVSVILSALFLGETPSSLLVVGSLVPVAVGVVLASMTAVSFNWIGFWSAMASNLTLQSQNVFSKKLLADKEETLDDINLFSILTVMSFVLSVPIMMYVEGIKFSPSYLKSTGVNLQELCFKAAIACTCFHFNQQVSYSLLARISPVTHSVANSLKRVAVIVSSAIFFGTST